MKARKAMVASSTANGSLSIRRQCLLLSVTRSSKYFKPVVSKASDVGLMRTIDEIYLKRPFFGSRRITDVLCDAGQHINRKRVQRLMRLMGLSGMMPGPQTSRRHKAHPVFPYLLRGVTITRPNQVWATDITYIPLATGWAYLMVVMDWYSRAVLSFRVSNSLSTDFCISALQEAFERYGIPEIFNSDQGSQFTDAAFVGLLESRGVRVSMDGKGRCMDNIFVERLWRSLKYEEVYLHAYANVREAEAGIACWLDFYNEERRHQSLNKCYPMAVYRTGIFDVKRAA